MGRWGISRRGAEVAWMGMVMRAGTGRDRFLHGTWRSFGQTESPIGDEQAMLSGADGAVTKRQGWGTGDKTLL